ncbi:hypothetical protein GCM10020229_64800 [Kitasatospora albolonga]
MTPEAIEAATALSRVVEGLPPRLRLATAGLTAFLVTHSTPETTPAVVPEPLLSSTRTPTTLAALATPYLVPAMVPATWVPWPLPSWATASLSTKSQPLAARGARSVWLIRTPVSITYAVTPAPARSG